jgi:hypothetical protein
MKTKFDWVYFLVVFVLKLIVYFFIDDVILPSIPLVRLVLLETGIILYFLPLYLMAFPLSMKVKLMPGFMLVIVSMIQFVLTGIWMALLAKYELIEYSSEITIVFAISYFIYTFMQILFINKKIKEARFG